jgi:hypothetical protein
MELEDNFRNVLRGIADGDLYCRTSMAEANPNLPEFTTEVARDGGAQRQVCIRAFSGSCGPD